MKKFLPLIILVVVIAVIGGVFFFLNTKKAAAPAAPVRTPNPEPVNLIDLKDRPYVTLGPKVGSRHPLGQELTMVLHSVTLGSKSVEYELEYQSGSLLQGAFGTIDLTTSQPPTTKDMLLGSCSTGGKCAYNPNVEGGTLTLHYKGGQQDFAVRGEWSLGKMTDRQGQFSSRDGKFQVDIGKTGLSTTTVVTVFQTLGLPAPVKGDVLAGPYGVFTNDQKPKGKVQLTLRLSQDVTTATLLGWTGTSWKEYKSTVANKTLTATVDSLTTFVATSK